MRFAYKRYEIPKSPLDGSTEIHRPEIVVHLIGEAGEIYWAWLTPGRTAW